MLGKWDAPGAAGASAPASAGTTGGGNAKTGGTYAPTDPVGASHTGTPESLHL